MTRICMICLDRYQKGRVTHFKFPNDMDGNVLRKWKRAAGIPFWKNPKEHHTVCARHFREDEIGQSQNGERKKHLINRNIYPTINVKNSDDVERRKPAIPGEKVEMCLVCYQAETSSKGLTLKSKSKHSDKTLLQIFGEINT